MCGRYTLTPPSPAHLMQRFESDFGEVGPEAFGRFNICPTETIAIVTGKGARPARWGLLPSWVTTGGRAPTMINARVETVASKPVFAKLMARPERRCLIIADGWYEWLRPEIPKAQPLPFRYVVDDGAPFAFAGLFTNAQVDGEWVRSATIITTAANGFCRPIHNRMPCVLADREAELAWLAPDVDAENATELLAPLPDARCDASPANIAVNRAGVEGPELLVAPDPA